MMSITIGLALVAVAVRVARGLMLTTGCARLLSMGAKAPISPPCRPAAFSSFSFKCQPRRLANYLGRKAEEKSEDFSMEDDARREV